MIVITIVFVASTRQRPTSHVSCIFIACQHVDCLDYIGVIGTASQWQDDCFQLINLCK